MSDTAIVVAGLELTALILGTMGFQAFKAWVALRERERLSVLAENRIAEEFVRVGERFKNAEAKLLELKNAGLARRT